MNLKLIVWHLNRSLAIARGLASETEHSEPYTNATCLHTVKDVNCAMRLWAARCYEPVAIVTYAPDPHRRDHYETALEFAYEKTNHITQPWNRRRLETDREYNVRPLHHEGNRSTSVGDIVEVIDDAATFKYICGRVGFSRIED